MYNPAAKIPRNNSILKHRKPEPVKYLPFMFIYIRVYKHLIAPYSLFLSLPLLSVQIADKIFYATCLFFNMIFLHHGPHDAKLIRN